MECRDGPGGRGGRPAAAGARALRSLDDRAARVRGQGGPMAQRPRVTVLGSLNTDISLPVPHLPAPGETVLAVAAATFGAGGKGANQAVAAARLGAAVRMAGCLGDDEFGARLRAGLAAEGVDVAGLRAIPGAVSGLALITVDPAGENSIAVAPGANGLAGAAEVAAAGQPADGVPEDPERAQAIAAILAKGPAGGQVVVTLGAAGAVLAGPAAAAVVPGFAVTAVDTVGAGDAFAGALAVALGSGLDPAAAVTAACAAGAAATTRRGAQEDLPRPADVLAATGFSWHAYWAAT